MSANNITIDSVYQAIITKYHGPTNTRGSRISATSASGLRVSVPYRSELNTEDNHRAAATALCAKYEWATRPSQQLVSGGLKDGYAWVIINVTAA